MCCRETEDISRYHGLSFKNICWRDLALDLEGGGGAVGKGVVRDGGWGESYTGRDGDDCPTCTFWGVKIPG